MVDAPTESDISEMRSTIDICSSMDKGALKEMKEHVDRCHSSELQTRINGTKVKCPQCLLAKMVDKAARKGSTRKPHNLETCAADTLIMAHESINGNKCATQLVMYGSLYGQFLPGKHKDSVSTARRFGTGKGRIESITDPGGKWKIEAPRHDPGTEFEGAMRNEREVNNLFPLRGSPVKEMSEMRCDKA